MEKRVFVFGRGYYYFLKKKEIKQKYSIDGFLDNAVMPGKIEMFEGIPTYNPEILKKNTDAIVIIAVSRGIIDIFYQIKKIGVVDNNIIFCHKMKPQFDVADSIFSCNARIFARDNMIYVEDQEMKRVILNDIDYKKYIKHYVDSHVRDVKKINELDVKPISESFGLEFGKPIDRVYIEKFLKRSQQYITGDILEVADNYYTNKYAYGKYKSYVMHVLGTNGALRVNLESGDGCSENRIDCFICTQTLQMILDTDSAIRNMYKLLRPEGVALVTIHGIAALSRSDSASWGEYWRMTKASCEKMFSKYFGKENVEVITYGNVKTACASLYGMCQEQLSKEDFNYDDERYQVVIGIVARKLL